MVSIGAIESGSILGEVATAGVVVGTVGSVVEMTKEVLNPTPKTPTPSSDTWSCPSCGQENITSKFCPECGTPKPAPAWTCPSCGATGINSKFCPECGRP